MRRGQRAPQFEREQKAEQHLEIYVTTGDEKPVKSIQLLTGGAASQKLQAIRLSVKLEDKELLNQL